MTVFTVTAASLRLPHLLLLLPALLLCTPAMTRAQDVPRGAIRGEVRAGGVPVAAADVELLRSGTVDRRGTTDANGRFLFVGVPIGAYEVRVSLIGYRTESAKNIRVAGGQTESVRLELEVAPVTLETMQVITSGVQVDTRSTEFATRISEQQIRLLPLGRDPKDVVALTPGARASHVWGGATAQANNYQIDGLAANHPGVGGDLLQLNMNWIDRIEVRGLGAGAEHGNFQGGLVNVVTKSGDNRTEVAVHSSVESHQLNASNLVPTEVGSEVSARYDVEVEARGPIVRDRFFYYLSGQLVDEDTRFLNHLLNSDARFSPVVQDGRELRYFGKLTWQPTTRDRVEGSVIRLDTRELAAGNTGYETREGTLNLERTATLYNLQAQHNWSSGTGIEAKVAHLGVDENRSSLGGADIPGIQTYALLPPYRAYQNAPMRFAHRPSSTTGTLTFTLRQKVAGYEHALKLGAEHSVGRNIDQRLRNGGMTWRPPGRSSLDASDPSTWFTSPSAPFVPLTIGGEVNLDAEVENSAAFAQATLGIGPYLSLNPGIRYGRWVGRITPAGGETFTAVEDQAFEPRLGAILDLSRRGWFVLKGHWGRYHQSMIAQFFDRVEGGNVFTNEEDWHYRGPVFTDPTRRFTEAEWADLQQQGLLERQRELVVNETGRVENYKQPYVNQWLVGVERSFGTDVKLEALYTRRSNRQMVALMDLNRATNYTRFEYIRVLDADGTPIPFEGGRAQFRELYIPNNRIIELLRVVARGECVDGCAAPPGMVPADTLGLSWNPEYVLTNAPDARRDFGQFQFSVQIARPTWGGSASVVLTSLEGNLDSVTGYDDPSGYGPGPYVRVNEGVNAFGKLGNFADRELKLSVYGNLPWQLQGGAFWTWATGDHFAPHFTFLARQGFYQYRTFYGNRTVFHPLLADLEGHRIFIGPRGRPTYETRASLDLRLEREFSLPGRGTVMLRAELFNLLNAATPTAFNTSINRGRNYYWFLGPQREGMFQTIDPNEYYRAVLERVPPRRLRIGTTVRF